MTTEMAKQLRGERKQEQQADRTGRQREVGTRSPRRPDFTTDGTDAGDMVELITSRNTMLKLLKAKGINTAEFKQQSDSILSDFAVACVQAKADELYK